MTPAQIVHERTQMAFWWCGLGFAVFFGVSLINMMGFVPPPSPMLTAEEIVAKYADRILLLRTGIVAALLGCAMYILWNVVLAVQIRRMEAGRDFPLLALGSLTCGLFNVVFFFIPFVFWAGAFYRMDRAPELILLINDMTWLEFVMIASPAAGQMFCLGAAVLSSTARSVVFPRWFGYMSLWMGVLGMPGVVAIFFLDGPFAWNGILAFWLPLVCFSIYMTCSFVVVYKAIKNHKNDVVTG